MRPKLSGRMTATSSIGGSRVVYRNVEIRKDYLPVSLPLPTLLLCCSCVLAYSELPASP